MDRFNTFTDRARRVLTMAQQEGQRFDHHYIGTEHLLLGLIREGDGMAANVLTSMGVDLLKVRTAVEFIIGRGDRPVVGEVGLTRRAKRVMELSIDEARRLGHNYIGTEHLLLGLVREGEGIAAGVLESLGVDLDRVRHEVIRLLAKSGSGGDPGYQAEATSWADDFEGSPTTIDTSPLKRVIGLGRVAVDAGVSVELIALEFRGAGCVLYWKAHPDLERQLGQPRCAVHDETETGYQVLPTSWSADPRESRGQMLVVPAPPDDAATWQIDFSAFAVPGQRWAATDEVIGTWHFEVAIT